MIFTCHWKRGIAQRLTGGVTAILSAFLLPALGEDAPVTDSVHYVRYGISSSMLVEVNETDARAAMKVWSEAATSQKGIPTEAEPLILRSQADLQRALSDGFVDVITMTTLEYLKMNPTITAGPFFISVVNDRMTDVYVVLVRADSGIADIEGLRGRSLIMCNNPKMSLAPLWLETELCARGPGTLDKMCRQVTKESKLAKVVLPVFFGTADACVVTRKGYDTMRELNPQLGGQLREIAASPEFVATLGFFRAGLDATLRDRMVSIIQDFHTMDEGRQMLLLFKCDRVAVAPPSCLDTARKLLVEHEALCREGGQ